MKATRKQRCKQTPWPHLAGLQLTTMDSPTEPGSPSPSTPSSGSPPPDELEQMQAISRGNTLLGKFTNSFSGGSSSASPSKRRLPGGSSFAAASNTRDTKSRRREDTGSSGRDKDRRGGGDREGWGDGKGRKDKDELVDGTLVAHLRRGEDALLLLTSGPRTFLTITQILATPSSKVRLNMPRDCCPSL